LSLPRPCAIIDSLVRGVTWFAVAALLAASGCSKKAAKEPPRPPPPDATVDYQGGGFGTTFNASAEVVKQAGLRPWSVGLSKAIELIAHVPDAAQEDYCDSGEALLKRINDRVIADPNGCAATLESGPAVELELTCGFQLPDPEAVTPERNCGYVYRAHLWTEFDARIENKYRVLATGWVQKRACAGPNVGKPITAHPGDETPVKLISNQMIEVLDACKKRGP
jgi:hypothetical protein